MWKAGAARVQQQQPALPRPQERLECEERLAAFNAAPVTQYFKILEGTVFWAQLPSLAEQEAFFEKLTMIKERGGLTVNDPGDPNITHFLVNVPGRYMPGETFTDEDLGPGAPGGHKFKEVVFKHARFWNGDHGEADLYMDKAHKRTRRVFKMEWIDEVLSGRIKLGSGDDDPKGEYEVMRRSSGPIRIPNKPRKPVAKRSIDPRTAVRPSAVPPVLSMGTPSAAVSEPASASSSRQVHFRSPSPQNHTPEQPMAIPMSIETDTEPLVVSPYNPPASPDYEAINAAQTAVDKEPVPEVEIEDATVEEPLPEVNVGVSAAPGLNVTSPDPASASTRPDPDPPGRLTPERNTSWPAAKPVAVMRQTAALTPPPDPADIVTPAASNIAKPDSVKPVALEAHSNVSHDVKLDANQDKASVTRGDLKTSIDTKAPSTGHKRALSVQVHDNGGVKTPRLTAMLPHRNRIVTEPLPATKGESSTMAISHNGFGNWAGKKAQRSKPLQAMLPSIIAQQPEHRPLPRPQPDINIFASMSSPVEVVLGQSSPRSSIFLASPMDFGLPKVAAFSKTKITLDPDMLYCATVPGVRKSFAK